MEAAAGGGAATGAEKSSSKSSRLGAGSGALAFAAGAVVVASVVFDLRGAEEVADDPLRELERRVETSSSSPASYSSYVFLEEVSLKPPLPPEE